MHAARVERFFLRNALPVLVAGARHEKCASAESERGHNEERDEFGPFQLHSSVTVEIQEHSVTRRVVSARARLQAAHRG